MTNAKRKPFLTTRELATVAILAAISAVLFMIEIPVVLFYKLDLSHLPVLLGAGGVGRMFATECALRGCRVTMAVRRDSMEKAEPVRAHIRSIDPQAQVEIADIASLNAGEQTFELMINATPVGMFPKVEASPVEASALKKVKTLFDCIYNPRQTRLMKDGEAAGCQVIGGLDMLVWQAVAAQEIWFGRQFKNEQVERVIAQLQEQL